MGALDAEIKIKGLVFPECMAGIEMIFFDIGGVLVEGDGARDTIRKAVAEYGLPPEMARIIETNHWIPFALGMTSEEEYWAGIKKDLGLEDELDQLKERAYESFHLVQETLDIAVELSKEYRIGIISNHSNEWSDYLIETFGFSDYFDPIIISSRVGMRKPGLGIYEVALRVAGIPAEKALFIDDRQDNIESAVLLGMQGIVFESPGQLREELKKVLGEYGED